MLRSRWSNLGAFWQQTVSRLSVEMLEMIELDNLLNGLFPVRRAKNRQIFDMRWFPEHLHTNTHIKTISSFANLERAGKPITACGFARLYQSRITSGSSRLVTLIFSLDNTGG